MTITSGSSRRAAFSGDGRVLALRGFVRRGGTDRLFAVRALGNLAVLGILQDLDRVFDRDDVVGACCVDDVDHRRKGRGFTRADRAGDQHKTVVIVEQALDVGHVMVEKTEFLERTDMIRYQAVAGCGAVFVHHEADAEPVRADLKREVDVHILLEALLALG